MTEKIKENLKSYTYQEIRQMITAINDEVAIKGMSKHKTKSALIDFLVKDHSHHFKKLVNKSKIKDLYGSIKSEAQAKVALEARGKASMLNKMNIDKMLKKKSEKDMKKLLISQYIATGKKLPESANDKVKELYKKAKKEYAKKLKAKREKMNN